MKDPKSVKNRRIYDTEFKQEMSRKLSYGSSAMEILESLGIAEKRYAVAASISLKENGNKKTKSNNEVDRDDKAAKLAAEVLERDSASNLQSCQTCSLDDRCTYYVL